MNEIKKFQKSIKRKQINLIVVIIYFKFIFDL
jgi:hypothetical protein